MEHRIELSAYDAVFGTVPLPPDCGIAQGQLNACGPLRAHLYGGMAHAGRLTAGMAFDAVPGASRSPTGAPAFGK